MRNGPHGSHDRLALLPPPSPTATPFACGTRFAAQRVEGTSLTNPGLPRHWLTHWCATGFVEPSTKVWADPFGSLKYEHLYRHEIDDGHQLGLEAESTHLSLAERARLASRCGRLDLSIIQHDVRAACRCPRSMWLAFR